MANVTASKRATAGLARHPRYTWNSSASLEYQRGTAGADAHYILRASPLLAVRSKENSLHEPESLQVLWEPGYAPLPAERPPSCHPNEPLDALPVDASHFGHGKDDGWPEKLRGCSWTTKSQTLCQFQQLKKRMVAYSQAALETLPNIRS